jgi:hypothetical protein
MTKIEETFKKRSRAGAEYYGAIARISMAWHGVIVNSEPEDTRSEIVERVRCAVRFARRVRRSISKTV